LFLKMGAKVGPQTQSSTNRVAANYSEHAPYERLPWRCVRFTAATTSHQSIGSARAETVADDSRRLATSGITPRGTGQRRRHNTDSGFSLSSFAAEWPIALGQRRLEALFAACLHPVFHRFSLMSDTIEVGRRLFQSSEAKHVEVAVHRRLV